jgi:hypothetical protein
MLAPMSCLERSRMRMKEGIATGNNLGYFFVVVICPLFKLQSRPLLHLSKSFRHKIDDRLFRHMLCKQESIVHHNTFCRLGN